MRDIAQEVILPVHGSSIKRIRNFFLASRETGEVLSVSFRSKTGVKMVAVDHDQDFVEEAEKLGIYRVSPRETDD
jgi:hypothetical protein